MGVDAVQIRHVRNSKTVKAFERGRPHAPQSLDGKRIEERLLGIGGHDHDATARFDAVRQCPRFGFDRRQLRQKLV